MEFHAIQKFLPPLFTKSGRGPGAEPLGGKEETTMADIKWLEVAINTTPERLDEVTARLTAAVSPLPCNRIMAARAATTPTVCKADGNS